MRPKYLYFKLYRRGIITEEENKTMKNKTNNEVRKAKKMLCTTLSLKNLIMICVYAIRSVINNLCTEKPIRSVFVNNIENTDVNLNAEAFGEYSMELAGNLEAEIPQASFDPLSLIPIQSESFF